MLRSLFTPESRGTEAKTQRYAFVILPIILALISSTLTPVFLPPALAISAPSPLTPAEGSTITATGIDGSVAAPPVAFPVFSWSPVDGAKTYLLQISQEIGFNNKMEFTTPLTFYTPPNAIQLHDGVWYWRVRAQVSGQEVSEFSAIQSFTRQWASPDNFPVLVSPEENETLEFYQPPSFSWQPVMGAAAYKFQIATASDFTTILYSQTTLSTTHQPLLKLANGSYSWRVIPLDAANREGTFSSIRSFNLGYNRIPQLIRPEDFSTPTFTPTFQWTAVLGAQFYRLQYSTDPTFNSGIIQVDTRNTTYTPTGTLPNDVNYYWRVRAHSGNSISDWSNNGNGWTFRKQWYIQPVLLTPVNLYQFVRFPFFSWTPVPGASSYKIEVDRNQDFVDVLLSSNTSNPFYMPEKYEGDSGVRYWRVTPYDGNGKAGKPGDVSSYWSSYTFSSPTLVAPLYYYPPNNFPAPDVDVAMDPHEDRTVSLPVFTWQRLTDPDIGATMGRAYRVQVSDDPLFGTVDWTVETENLNAAPTSANPFVPAAGIDYFWRVTALTNPGGAMVGEWSQIWKTRIDLSQGLSPTSGTAPQHIRPVRAAEWVETTPLFEWYPYAGADSYEVQISLDSAFASVTDSATIPYPAYAPTNSLGQRSLSHTGFGTYYWRVRAMSGGAPLSQWSTPWSFQIAAQSERFRSRTAGSTANRLLIAVDPDDTADNNYELTNLYAAQDTDYWYFSFNATTAAANMKYAVVLDVDHKDNVGATFAPLGYPLSTISAHRPEFVIFVSQTGGSFSAGQTAIYAWNGSGWNPPQLLNSVGGALSYDATAHVVELKVPNTAIGMQDTTGSYAVSVVSMPATAGAIVDSVPSDPNAPGSGQLSRFASVSERLNPVRPATDFEVGRETFPFSSVQPFFWDYPTGSSGTAPWAGATMKVYLDPQFTTEIANFELKSDTSYYSPGIHAWPNDFRGDNSYYWRIRPRYLDGIGPSFGAWSQGMRFERRGFIPQNLQESVTFATPTFSWDMVEGAKTYDLQVDNDPNYGSPAVSINTTQNSFTPNGTLPNGLYYWRVRVQRDGNITNEWTQSKTFTLALPQPTGLTPNDPQAQAVVGKAPTFCWDAVLKSPEGGVPVLAAYKYRVQISRGDPTFSVIYEAVDTEQTCYTPSRGYDDGQYYWRVAMIDGQGLLGEFSPAAQFTKQYPITTLVSPISGRSAETPIFVWTPVHGAAAYRIEIATDRNFSQMVDAVTTNHAHFTPTKIYASGRTYYWRVAIIDKDNKIGPFNDATIILGLGGPEIFLPLVKR